MNNILPPPSGDYYFSFGGLSKKFGGLTRVMLLRISLLLSTGNRCIILNSALGRHFRENLNYIISNGYDGCQKTKLITSEDYFSKKLSLESILKIKTVVDTAKHIEITYKDSIAMSGKVYDKDGQVNEYLTFYNGNLMNSYTDENGLRRYKHYAPNGFIFLTYDYERPTNSRKNIILHSQADETKVILNTYEDYTRYFFRSIMQEAIDCSNGKLLFYFNDNFLDPGYELNIEAENLYKIGQIHGVGMGRPLKPWHSASFNPRTQATYKEYCPYDAIIYLTEEQKNDTEKRYGCRSCNFVVPNSIDIPIEIKPFTTRDKLVGVYIARFEYQKKPLDIIEAWQKVAMEVPDAKMMFYGFGNLETKMREKIKQYQLEEYIKIAGYTDKQHVPNILQSALFSLHPTDWEGQPLSLYESIANGCVPIVYDFKYGLKEILEFGKPICFKTPIKKVDYGAGNDGIFHNIDILAQQIIHAFKNPDELAQMSENGRDFITKFNHENNMIANISLLKEIFINKHKRNSLSSMEISKNNNKIYITLTGYLPSDSNLQFGIRLYDKTGEFEYRSLQYTKIKDNEYEVFLDFNIDKSTSLTLNAENSFFEKTIMI